MPNIIELQKLPSKYNKVTVHHDKIIKPLKKGQNFTDHADYLASSHWRDFRLTALKARNHKCQNCSKKYGLNVHHRSYDNLWKETMNDIDVLCRGCHERTHFTKSGQKRKKVRDVRVNNQNSYFYNAKSPVLRKCPSCEGSHPAVYAEYASGIRLIITCPKTKPRTKFIKFEPDLPIPTILKGRKLSP